MTPATMLGYNFVRRSVFSRTGRMVAPSAWHISRKIPFQLLSDSSYLQETCTKPNFNQTKHRVT